MTDFLTRMIADVSSVITAAIAAAAAIYVAAVWWRTKALVPTVTAVVMAGVVVWATANIDVLEQRGDVDADTWIQTGAAGGAP